MSDASALVDAFQSGALRRPSKDTPNIVDLAGAIAGLAGATGRSQSPNAAGIAGLIGAADHFVFVMVDGMGMSTVRSHGDGAFVASHVVAELQSVFPTSTPVVLTSLATGVWPAVHGVPGWHLYLQEIDVVTTIIQYARRSDEMDLSKLGMEVGDVFPLPSVVSEFDRDAVSFLPAAIAGTPYSNYTSGNARNEPYQKLDDAVEAITARISSSKTPTMTQLYIPDVDRASHEFGTESAETRGALEQVDAALERLAGSLPPQGRLVATADHGLLDFDAGQYLEIDPGDPLTGYLAREPWGTARAVNFDVRGGVETAFGNAFRDRFGQYFYLLTVEEAVELELYGPGPLSPVTRRRVGTHLAISRGPAVFRYRYPTNNKDEDKRLLSHHAGLTAEEMLVPLVVA